MEKKTSMDEHMRRFGAIIASPSLALHPGHTTPTIELAWLRRIGLEKTEAMDFLELLCQRGLLDAGAEAVLKPVALALNCDMAAAARNMLAGGLPVESGEDGEKE